MAGCTAAAAAAAEEEVVVVVVDPGGYLRVCPRTGIRNDLVGLNHYS